MELSPEQIAAIVGSSLGVALATTATYLSGKARGMRLGQRDGYSTALDRLGPDLHETTERLNSAQRILAATQAELHLVQDQRSRERLQAVEALEEVTQRLDEAQSLNAGHTSLLRQACTTLDLAAATFDAITATTEARDARTLSSQLRELIATLTPERQEIAA